jgi:post-segregation antitoxin (ccd killing protein)
MATDRITITLPRELVLELARAAKNRSRFVAEAIRRELDRRRREALRAALENPHPETAGLVEVGWGEWAAATDPRDADLVDPAGGTPIQWSAEKGWTERDEPRPRKRRPRRS